MIFVFTPLKYFYYIRQRANQSWITYNTVIGRDISYPDAIAHTKTQKSNLRKIAFIEIIVKYAGAQRGQKKGLGGILTNLFLSAFVEIWDLLSNYMIPAVVVEQKPLSEIVSQIKDLRNNVPATLVGVFGIDFAGNVVGSLLTPIYLFLLFICGFIAYFITPLLPNTTWILGSIVYSWVPLIIGLYVIFVINSIVRKLVESVKTIYFTIFYTAIRTPDYIRKDMKDELTHYLRLEE